MPEWLIPIFVLFLIYLYFTMKTPTSSTEKPESKSTTEQVIAPVASKAKPKKASTTSKVPKKAPAVATKPVVATTDMTPTERTGLTAGSIWHYLADNGATSIAKLVRALPEDEKTIQRSIGWLAQEGKITLSMIERVETIALKE
jgi:hypothetical protein